MAGAAARDWYIEPRAGSRVVASASAGMRALTVLGNEEQAALGAVERLLGGDAAALGEIYDEHHEAVRGFARRLVGDAAAAEDLVQEVFVALPGLISRYRGQSSLRSFITGVAVNHARHHVRGAVRRRAAMDRFAAQPSAATAGQPEQELCRRGLAEALTLALDRLPLRQRVAFVLCDVEERSAREAAAIAGAPEATMRTRLHHARKKLRAELARLGVQP